MATPPPGRPVRDDGACFNIGAKWKYRAKWQVRRQCEGNHVGGKSDGEKNCDQCGIVLVMLRIPFMTTAHTNGYDGVREACL